MKSVVQSFYNWYSSKIKDPKYRWLIILGTLIYLFSPLDLSPDLFPIVGWLDDGVVVTLLMTELSRLVADYRQHRKKVVEVNSNSPSVNPVDIVKIS
jgi:uncharacterized membrane protein YkvA (DUF1232 family)